MPTESDFDAFCVDHFKEVSECFATGMDRVARTTYLLDLVDDEQDLLAALKEFDPERFGRHIGKRSQKTQANINPYRGLAAFQLEDAHLFFGRTTLTAVLWQRFETIYEKANNPRLLIRSRPVWLR